MYTVYKNFSIKAHCIIKCYEVKIGSRWFTKLMPHEHAVASNTQEK